MDLRPLIDGKCSKVSIDSFYQFYFYLTANFMVKFNNSNNQKLIVWILILILLKNV